MSFAYNTAGGLRESDHLFYVGPRQVKAKRQLFYDALGRLSSVFIDPTDPQLDNYRITYRYDARGRRILRREERVRGPANTVMHSRETRFVFWAER